jgi:polyhydroxybutyrate depolymerase
MRERTVCRAAPGTALALLILALVFMALSVLLRPARAETPPWRALAHGGAERGYHLAVPESARARAGAAPLVVLLHGGGGTAAQILRHTRFAELAASEGFVLVAPQGENRSWNDGRVYSASRESRADDVGFIRAVLADLARQGVAFDRDRVFATGISNGGFMSQRLACEAADAFLGIVSVTAQMSADLGPGCKPARPISVWMINGTADPLVPYEGGQVRAFGRARGTIWSTEATMNFWARANGCVGQILQRPWPDADPGDGTTVRELLVMGCPRVRVGVVRVVGGGHTWPGASQYLPPRLVGVVSRDFDATAAIWRFFASLPGRR